MSSSRVPKAQLLVILEEHEFRVTLEGSTTSIGSDPDCKLALTSPGVEARHCVFQRGESGFEVFDLFSESGTLVNGQKVEGHALRTGDQITIGSVRIVYLETGVPAATATPPSTGSANDAREVEAQPAPVTGDPWDAWQEDPFFDRKATADGGATSPAAPSPPETIDLLPPREEPAPAALPAPVETPAPAIADTTATGSFSERLRAWRERRAGERVRRQEEKARRRREKAGQDASDQQRAAAAAAAVVVPALDRRTIQDLSNAHRFHPTTFNDILVEQLRSTPYYGLSLILHVCIAIILNWLTTTHVKPQEIPPYTAGFENRDLETTDEIDAEIPEIEDPDVTDVEEDVDVVEPVEKIEDNDPLDQEVLETSDGSEEGPPLDAFTTGLDGGGLGSGLRGFGGANVGGKNFRRYVRSLRESGLDIVVVIDSTGSMETVIHQARAQVSRMIATVAGLVPSFRLGVVTYRDRGDDYVTRDLRLTPNYYEAVDFLDGLDADGGGDIPEAVFEGVKTAIREMPWSKKSKRVVVLIGDARPHARDMNQLRALVSDFSRRNGSVHTVVTATDGSTRADTEAKRSFRAISKSGAGVAVDLEDSGQVVRKIIEVAFGPEHKDDVGEAIDQTESGWRSRRYRRMIDQKDLKAILSSFRKKPAPQLLFRELMMANQAAFLPAYLAALEDPSVTLQARWAATVLTKRLVMRSRDRRVRDAAAALSPKGSSTAVRRRVTDFRRVARAAGYPTVLPE